LALVHRGHAVIDRRDGHRCSFVRQAQRLESSQSFFTNQVALLPQAGVLAILHEAQRHVILDQRGVLEGVPSSSTVSDPRRSGIVPSSTTRPAKQASTKS